ncbi:MAG: ATP-dependent DNA helicase RecG [Actinomycetota bacterium]|nr:ATP-dependent DNA helicase RecG [Actinomycetota bacterium]
MAPERGIAAQASGRVPIEASIARHFADTRELTGPEARAAPLRSIPRPSRLRAPLGLRGRAARAAGTLGLETFGDLLEHLPDRHLDREERPLAALVPGEEATVGVVVKGIATRPMRRRRGVRVEARVADSSGPALAVWFNQPWVAHQLDPGATVLLRGALKRRNEFHVREWEPDNGAGSAVHTLGRVAVYRAADGISKRSLRELAQDARDVVGDTIEPLPAAVRTAERLPDRPAALAAAHFPETDDEQEVARERLALEELLLLELALGRRKRERRIRRRAAALALGGELVDPWRTGLAFDLTGDQRAAIEAIDRDLASEAAMHRLLMGEVGSGKTVVALHAMLRAVEDGRQAALMAPTETLAEQHLATLDRLLGGVVPIALLTGATPAARRRELLGRLESGELAIVVGTHALIEPTVRFRDLAVAVVDEEHRFGVRQREALDAKAPDGRAPHLLHLTATPIPRTLELTSYGDLEVTALRELPRGRRPVETHVVSGERARSRAYERAREEIARGRQCFVVCSLVEASEALQARAATAEAERLRATEFRDHRVALVHGQLATAQKQAAMEEFASGSADVLVATSVIEVGIDVPNATTMLVEEAERYGLSQLHQLRGRVGRGEDGGVCILFGDPKLPRLEAIARETNGFRLAEVDLELRGAGEVLGTRQHGLPRLKFAELPEDGGLLVRARARAEELLEADPRLEAPEHALLRAALEARFDEA